MTIHDLIWRWSNHLHCLWRYFRNVAWFVWFSALGDFSLVYTCRFVYFDQWSFFLILVVMWRGSCSVTQFSRDNVVFPPFKKGTEKDDWVVGWYKPRGRNNARVTSLACTRLVFNRYFIYLFIYTFERILKIVSLWESNLPTADTWGWLVMLSWRCQCQNRSGCYLTDP